MDYYLDLTLLPDEEIPIFFIRNKVYTKLHKTIFDLKATDIGISFPQAKDRLGCIIRIHSNQERLQVLHAKGWLGGLSGYCKMSDILPIPDKIKGYQTLSRIRQTMTQSKLNKKIDYLKSKGFIKTDDEAKTYIKQYKAKMFKTALDNPYLELQSTSTNNKYRLYIAFGDLQKMAIDGEFNRFGLSKTATVPWF